MKKWLVGIALAATCTSSAWAATIGVSVAWFDDNWLTSMRNAMQQEANKEGNDIQFLDAQGDIGRQLSQVQSLASQNVDAIIINPVDTAATMMMTKVAVNNGIPLVYVNRKPEGKDLESDKVVFVGSDNYVAGKLQMEELAKLIGEKGNVAIMMGELSSSATYERTRGVTDVAKQYPNIKIVDKQAADYKRTEAIDLMNNWIVGGKKIDAVAANNDEMALGAMIAMKQSGMKPSDIAVAGIDATRDALDSLERGEMSVTVFQDAKGQGAGSVKAANALIEGKNVDKITMIPFKLVTKNNLEQYQ
ncbi:substrate-binding domain-containing protein [Larsenimonas salina]|uniref:substrate-binding domain-containing protein n=1 Tax=Larsenimonas salina TaxID=1295565 RepID=UPI0020738503|nr:substrate-binding domain-containing protein [Larsenimonas salina]MCM5704606.1 substrate-binding domain-containing protein [Larsenimonas salina]